MCSNYNLLKLAVAVPLRAKTKAIHFGIAFVLHLRDRRTLLKAEDALVCLQANLATDFPIFFVSKSLNVCSNYNLKKLAVAVPLRAKTKAIHFGIAFVLHLRDRRTLIRQRMR